MKASISSVTVEIIPDTDPIQPFEEPWDPTTESEEVRDRLTERSAAFDRGDWWYVGVRATAEIHFMGAGVGTLGDRIVGTFVSSPGLWSVESDNEDEYLEQVGAEELATLTAMLLALGLPQAEVADAIGNATRKER
jgi:hypothetical protein